MARQVLKIGVLAKHGQYEGEKGNDSEILLSGGYEYDFLKMVVSGLGCSYKAYTPADNEWGRMIANGRWSGLVGMVSRGEVDMAISHLYLLPDREKFLYSYPYSEARFTFATRHPKELHSPMSLVYAFDAHLWLYMGIMVLVMPFVFKSLLSSRQGLADLFMSTLKCIFRQDPKIKVAGIRDALLVGHWLLVAALLSMIYSSVMHSFLTVPLREEGVKDFKSLLRAVQAGKMKSLVVDGEDAVLFLCRSEEETTRSLFTLVSERDWNIPADVEVVRGNVFAEKNAVVTSEDVLRRLLGTTVFVSEDRVVSYPIVILLRDDFELLHELDRIIHRVAASGVVRKMVDDHLLKRNAGLFWFETAAEGPKELSIQHLAGAFVVLVAGYKLSLFVLLVEICVGRFNQQNLEENDYK